MTKYTIISTYPEAGSQNIGDQLITSSLIEAIKNVKGQTVTVDTVWREDSWDKVKTVLNGSEAIIFACLAIRPNFTIKQYPYIMNLLDCGLPLFVVSAGTALPVDTSGHTVFKYVSKEAEKALLKLDKQAISFTTRGYLTQAFCENIGLENAKFAGDIAFVSSDKDKLKFISGRKVQNIVVSDPHYAKDYLAAFDKLIKELKKEFKDAKITIALHGNDQTIVNYAQNENLPYLKIYDDRYSGLKLYDDADLHVGFRVHAHVSALKRRKYSYLLEQDGRGCDYGLTLERKISIPNYRKHTNSIAKKALQKLMRFLNININNVSSLPAEQIVALIKQDSKQGFEKFIGLENQIEKFSEDLINELNKLP